jgi:hypothetical protein
VFLAKIFDRHDLKEAWSDILRPLVCDIQDSDEASSGTPDVSDILKRKEEGRREITRRSLGEMRVRLALLKRIREERRANRLSGAPNSPEARHQ